MNRIITDDNHFVMKITIYHEIRMCEMDVISPYPWVKNYSLSVSLRNHSIFVLQHGHKKITNVKIYLVFFFFLYAVQLESELISKMKHSMRVRYGKNKILYVAIYPFILVLRAIAIQPLILSLKTNFYGKSFIVTSRRHKYQTEILEHYFLWFVLWLSLSTIVENKWDL